MAETEYEKDIRAEVEKEYAKLSGGTGCISDSAHLIAIINVIARREEAIEKRLNTLSARIEGLNKRTRGQIMVGGAR